MEPQKNKGTPYNPRREVGKLLGSGKHLFPKATRYKTTCGRKKEKGLTTSCEGVEKAQELICRPWQANP